jgi:dUTP pyrophosphatase
MMVSTNFISHRNQKIIFGFIISIKYSIEDTIIAPGSQTKIGTGITLEIPKGYHGQLHVQSGHTIRHCAQVEAGTIDSDYQGEIFIVMSNNGKSTISIKAGEQIAQLLVIKDPKVIVDVKDNLTLTTRNTNGFGSTGVTKLGDKSTLHTGPTTVPVDSLQKYPPSTAAAAATMQGGDQEPVCNVDISHDPFNDTQKATIMDHGNHPMKGLLLDNSETWNEQVIITTYKSGTPASKIKNWRKRLKGSMLLKIGDVNIMPVVQVHIVFETLPQNEAVDLTIGLVEKLPMHDTNGVPMIYFDQLTTVATHL